MRHNRRPLNNEVGSALMVVVWTSVILLTLGAGVAFTTASQRLQSARDVNSLNALNIAEAVANERIETWNATGTVWDATATLTTATGTVSNGVRSGTYTLSVTTDTRGAAYKLITATGTFNGLSKTIKVVVKAFPQIFTYAVASNGKLELKAEEDKPITIIGPIHTNGNMKLESEDGGIIDLSQASGTFTGSLSNPDGIANSFVYGPPITLPLINISYYSNPSNFPGQTVYDIDLASPPAWLNTKVNDKYIYRDNDKPKKYTIPASVVNTQWPNGIVNFYQSSSAYDKEYEVKITGPGAPPMVILNQTFTARNFGELEFDGFINLLPTNGQAIISYNMKETEIEGGVQVGAIGNGALMYSYGTGDAGDGYKKGKIEIEDGSSLYGSLIQNMAEGLNSKGEIEGGVVRFDAAFIDKLGTGAQSQFADWGNFDLKKIHYGQ